MRLRAAPRPDRRRRQLAADVASFLVEKALPALAVRLPPATLSLPPQADLCSLAGTNIVRFPWTRKAAVSLSKKELTIRISKLPGKAKLIG